MTLGGEIPGPMIVPPELKSHLKMGGTLPS